MAGWSAEEMERPVPADQVAPEGREVFISIRGLHKRFGPRHILRGIDLDVGKGETVVILGLSGSGKTTLIKHLMLSLPVDEGAVRVGRFDLARLSTDDREAYRGGMGVVFQHAALLGSLTVEENVGLPLVEVERLPTEAVRPRVVAALKRVFLPAEEILHLKPDSLSGGMRRRLLVAKALVHSPPVVVLDEPTAGVDVELRRSLWSYMRSLNAQGVTVVLTTHYLEEAEALCDRLAIIDHGQVVAVGATRELLARLDEKELHLTPTGRLDELPAALRELGAELLEDGRIRVRYRPSRADVGAILERARQAGIGIRDLATSEADLEELFLRLTASRSPALLQGARRGAVLGEETV